MYILPDYLVNINVRKQAINDKLQGSVATCLKYGGVFNNQIKKGLLMSLSVKNNQIRWIFRNVTSKNVCCVMHFGRLATTLPKDEHGSKRYSALKIIMLFWKSLFHQNEYIR